MLSFLSLLHLCVLLGIALRIFSRRNAHGTAVGWLLLVILLPVSYTHLTLPTLYSV